MRHINPVTRLGAAIVLTFPLLLSLDWVSATVACCFDIGLYLADDTAHWRPRLATLCRRMIPLFLAAPLAGLTMALYGKAEGQIYFNWGFMVISDQSVAYGIAIMVRVVALGLACLATLSDTDPTDMADGLTQVVHLPSRFVLGTLAGLRLVGALQRDWKSMELARRARGLGDSQALKRFATLAFALLVSAIRRGATLATAMEARGFSGGPRTWARESRVGWRDAIYLATTAALITLALLTAYWTGQFRWIGTL